MIFSQQHYNLSKQESIKTLFKTRIWYIIQDLMYNLPITAN